MKLHWQYRLSTLFGVIATISVLAALLARYGVVGGAFFVLSATLLTSVVGFFRGNPILGWGGLLGFVIMLVVFSPLCIVAVWDGRKSVPLSFAVLDAATNQPIAGAVVRLREIRDPVPTLRIPPGERGTTVVAGADGSVLIPWVFDASGREGTLEHSGLVFFGNVWIQSSAPGYASQLIPLQSLTGRSRDISHPVPPQMKIMISH